MPRKDNKSKKLIFVVGPTAVGKTGISIQLAKHFNTEIISTDSRQFYKEMSIGTAKPNKIEMDGIPHHFIDNLSIAENYSAGQYEIDALQKLDELFTSNDTVIAVGGSGLFVNSIYYGLDDIPSVPDQVRKKLNDELDEKGIEFMQEKVKLIDPLFYNKVDIQNKHRLLRCLEVWETSGQKLSDIQTNEKKERGFDMHFIGLNMDREKLHERINLRVDLMVEQGLLAEVESLKEHKSLSPMQTVGYQEFYNNDDPDVAIELVKRNSRRYAKRQITWFKKSPGITWFEPSQLQDIIHYVERLD